jgi:septum formation protein
MDVDLYLASQSPRRQALLRQMGVRFAVQVADIDEAIVAGETPKQHVQRLAQEKANSIWNSLSDSVRRPVLGADTIVTIDGEILGKPQNEAAARHSLNLLSGRTHEVMTAVALISDRRSVCVNVSQVSFRKLSDNDIKRYWASGEAHDKAGGYAIQGFAAAFVSNLSGSFSGVVGLPLFETCQLLVEHNVPIWQDLKYE